MNIRPPSDVQVAALRAALLPAPACHEAWGALRALTDNLDVLDASTFRALPMVYRNLKTHGVPEAELAIVRGVYRQAWYRNRLVVRSGLRAIAELREAGIEPVALKGLGLISTVYAEAALRPMEDVDLLLPAGTHVAAARALMAKGWRPTRGTRARFFKRFEVFHGMPLIGDEAIEVDLHRAMLEENTAAGSDVPMFRRVRDVELDGASFQTLSPEDHVLNACVHGTRWDWVPSVRWVLDLSAILRGTPEFDWPYLVGEARRRHCTGAVAAALEFAQQFEPLVAAAALGELRDAPTGRLERWAFRTQQAEDRILILGARNLLRYARMAHGRSPWRQLSGFPVYLEWIWELESPRQIPGDLFRRLRRRLPRPLRARAKPRD